MALTRRFGCRVDPEHSEFAPEATQEEGGAIPPPNTRNHQGCSGGGDRRGASFYVKSVSKSAMHPPQPCCCVQNLRCASIQSLAASMESGSKEHRRTRPSFSRRIKPASPMTFRCFEMAMSETSNGSARSLTDALPSLASRVRIARRIGCANAANVRSNLSSEKATTCRSHNKLIGLV